MSKIKLVMQTTNNECGICCVSMVASYFRYIKPISFYRNKFNIGRDGTSIKDLYIILNQIGFNTKAYNIIEFKEFEFKNSPYILYLNRNHFIVLEKVLKKHAIIFDPSKGRLKVSLSDLESEFGGYALEVTPSEEFSPNKNKCSDYRYLYSILSSVKSWFLLFLMISIATYSVSLVIPILLKKIIDIIVAGSTFNISFVIKSIVALFLGSVILTQLRNIVMIKLQCLLYEKLNMKTIYHLFRIPYSFFDNRSQGNILFRLGLLEQVQNIITSSLIQMIIALTSFLVVTVYFFSTLPEIIPLIIGIVFFIGIYVLTIGKFLIKKRKEELEASEKVNNIVTEIVVNMFQIKCLHLEHYFSDRYTYRFNNLKDKFKNHQTYSATFSLFINVFATFIPVVLVVFLISSDKYNFSVGQIFVVYTLLGTLLTYVTNFFNELTSFRLLRTSLYYLNDMLDEPEVNNSYNEKINSFESIHVDNVSFAYNDMSESILKSIDIKVKKGDKVAIVGNSGSGKTTLVKLLTRLYLPTKGNIYINGIDYSYIDPNIYGSIIAVVPQIPITFNKTIRDNITLEDKNIDDGKIIKALKIANLYNEVKSMPMGLNTFLSGQGGNLSGGQIQRLALARALVREPELLILDESTSSLDSINENKIYENLNKENITTIVISHRLSTVKDANVIYVISLGNMVEYGSHVELMKKQGIYSNMFAQQDPA